MPLQCYLLGSGWKVIIIHRILPRCWCVWSSMGVGGMTFELQDSGDLFSEVANANQVRSVWLPYTDAVSNFSALINNPTFENQEGRRECVKFNCGYLGSQLLFCADYLQQEDSVFMSWCLWDCVLILPGKLSEEDSLIVVYDFFLRQHNVFP